MNSDNEKTAIAVFMVVWSDVTNNLKIKKKNDGIYLYR